MKRKSIFFILLALPLLVQAIDRNSLATYASSLKGLKKEALKTAAYNVMNENLTTLGYGSGINKTWWGFYYTDRIAATNECVNRYSANKYYFGSSNTGQAIDGMNIEHSFPSSWWGGTKNNAYKDLFNLYPSDSQANSSKSNYPMGVVTTVKSEEPGYDKVGYGTIDGQSGEWCWEPGDQYKGDFSRAYMYMATTYQNLTWKGEQGLQQLEKNAWPTLKQWAYTLYMQWVRNDPVSQLEIDRNNAVYGRQKNRNLFVDYPYLAEYIWGDSVNVAFNPETSITTASDDSRFIDEIPAYAVSEPNFSPEGGTYTTAQTVSISCSTPDVTIYYTTDGSDPVAFGVEYTGAITVGESMTIKAVAIDADGQESEVATAVYVISAGGSGGTGGSEIFVETFDLCNGTGGNSGGFSGSVGNGTFTPDNEGWAAASSFGADKCARFGSGKQSGAATTPTFNIDGETTLTFRAAPFGTDGTSLKLSVSGNATLSKTEFTMVTGEFTTYTLTLSGSGPMAITFTPAKRFFLDDVSVVAPEAEILMGDINRDGEVTITDVTCLVQIIIDNLPDDYPLYEMRAADINGDGEKSVTDVIALVNLVLSK